MDENRALGAEAMLLAANGSYIGTYDKETLDLELGRRSAFQLEFTIVDVARPILEIYLFSHFEHSIDPKQLQIQNPSTSLTVNASRAKVTTATRITGISEQNPGKCT